MLLWVTLQGGRRTAGGRMTQQVPAAMFSTPRRPLPRARWRTGCWLGTLHPLLLMAGLAALVLLRQVWLFARLVCK